MDESTWPAWLAAMNVARVWTRLPVPDPRKVSCKSHILCVHHFMDKQSIHVCTQIRVLPISPLSTEPGLIHTFSCIAYDHNAFLILGTCDTALAFPAIFQESVFVNADEASRSSSSLSHKKSDFIFGVRKRRKVHSVPLAFSGGFYHSFHHQLASSSSSSSSKMRRSNEVNNYPL